MKRRRDRSRKRSRKALLVEIVLGVIVCVAGFAFTASLVVNASQAGDGSGAVSSFTVATLVYELDATNPAFIANVRLTFSGGTPGEVKAQIGGGSWSSLCTNSGGTFTCSWTTEPAIPGNNTTNLHVVAIS